MRLQIILAEGTGYTPGATLHGVVEWDGGAAPISGSIELSWTTRGKGDTSTRTVASLAIERLPRAGDSGVAALEAADARPFTIELPRGPYSFSGTLITLTWTLRAALMPSSAEHEVELQISPSRAELRLGAR